MADAWAEKLSCAIQCHRCDRQLAPTDPRILSVYDHEAICTACKDDEENGMIMKKFQNRPSGSVL